MGASRFTRSDLARVTPVRYTGKVWCLRVPTGAFVARRNGKVFITGNSGFPKGKGNLKPAWEPIILCRKPGAKVRPLGIDECRIESNRKDTRHGGGDRNPSSFSLNPFAKGYDLPSGRWPANIILDEEAAAMLDEQSGTLKSGANPAQRHSDITRGIYGEFRGHECYPVRGADSGGASRFFYCAKASRAERNAGCEGLQAVGSRRYGERSQGALPQQAPQSDVFHANHHPTVKPVALMSWLVRLVCPPGGIVLDPFMGSGTTGVAAVQEGREFIGIEREAEYLEISQARIDHATRQGRLVIV